MEEASDAVFDKPRNVFLLVSFKMEFRIRLARTVHGNVLATILWSHNLYTVRITLFA